MSTGRAAGLLCAVVAVAPAAARADTAIWQYASTSQINGAEPLPNGHVLIVEKQVGRVIELVPDFPDGGRVVWQVGGFNQPDRARRLPSGNTLITDTASDRVFEVDDAGVVVRSFGTPGLRDCSASSLNNPSDALRLSNGDTLIADQGENRLLQLSAAGAVTWSYSRPDCGGGSDAGELYQPFSVDLIDGGDILEAEVFNSRVLRIRPAVGSGGTVIWEFDQLSLPVRAGALANGNVLIADTNNQRVIEVSPTFPSGGTVVWQYGVTGQTGSTPGYLTRPYDAHRLENGDTLIAESDGMRVQLIAPDAGAASLAITSAPLDAGVLGCMGPVDVQLRDVSGAAAAATAPLTVALADSAQLLTFFDGAGCAVQVTGVPVGVGQSTVSAWVQAAGGGTTTLTASAPWLSPASQLEQFGVPDAGSPDAGAVDAGMPDAGVPDAGVPDAGSTDAGVPDAGAPDAGVPDAGVAPFKLAAGCGCATSLDAGTLTWLLLLAGAARRRRHQSA